MATDVKKAALEKAANAARARVQDTLKRSVERDVLRPQLAVPRFSKVETVVSDVLDSEALARADEGLLSVGDIDDEARFQAFAEKLTQLEESHS